MYASKLDIINLYGQDFLLDLLPTDLDNEVSQDNATNTALESAAAEIDGYLSARYSLPLSTSPQVLKRPNIDIAAYVLANTASRASEELRDRYEDAIAFLKRLANGTAGLGKDEPKIDGGGDGAASSSGAHFSANPRKHRRGLM